MGLLLTFDLRPSGGGLAEPGAGLLPLALGAPLVPVLHAVDLAAFLGFAARPAHGRLLRGRGGRGGGGRVGRGRERLGSQSDVFASLRDVLKEKRSEFL